MLRYKQLSPPEYNLNNIKAPIALYYAQADWLADLKDVDALTKLLSSVTHTYKIPHEHFNHIDFLYGMSVQRLLNDEIVKMLNLKDNFDSNSVD